MATIRYARLDDSLKMIGCPTRNARTHNKATMLENFFYYQAGWSRLVHVAVNYSGRNEDLCGYICGQTKDEDTMLKGVIRDVAVWHGYRREGIGRRLVEKFNSNLIQVYDADVSTVTVEINNSPALSFFEAMGYVLVRHVSDHLVKGGEGLLLEKSLKGVPEEQLLNPRLESRISQPRFSGGQQEEAGPSQAQSTTGRS